MKSRSMLLLALSAALMMIAAVPAAAGGRPLGAELNGLNEVTNAGVPGVGDPDGSGIMQLTLNQGQGEICWDLDVSGIANPTRAHIHDGEAGVNGGIVVSFFDSSPGTLNGCVDGVEKELIKDVRQNPQNYYINVHNAEYPGGALRGQLSK